MIDIVIIDDGSTDSSPDIIREYCRRYDTIQAYTQENKGQAAANNRGIRMSRSEYIGFADSDDYLVPDMYKKLLVNAEENQADLVMCNVMSCLPQDRQKIRFSGDLFTPEIVTAADNKTKLLRMLGPWNKLIKKSLLDKNNIRFQEEVKIHIDNAFSIKTILCAEKISLLNEPLYYYNKTNDTSSTNHTGKRLFSVFPAVNEVERVLTASNLPEFRSFFNSYKSNMFINDYLSIKQKYKTEFLHTMSLNFTRADIPADAKLHIKCLLLSLTIKNCIFRQALFVLYETFLTIKRNRPRRIRRKQE